MANGYDGDIKLSVGLSLEDVQTRAKELRTSLQKVFDSVNGKKLDAAASKLLSDMSKTASQVEKVSQEIDKLNAKKLAVEDYENTQLAIENVKRKLTEAMEAKQKLQAEGTKVTDPAWKEAEAEITRLKSLLESLKDDLVAAEEAGNTVFTEEDAARLGALKNQMADLNNTTRTQITAFEELGKTKAPSKLQQVLERLKTTVQKGLSTAFNTAKSKLSGLISKFTQGRRASNSFGQSIGQMVKKFLSYGLGIATIATLFNKIRSAIKDGLNSMAQMNSGVNQTNAALSSLQSSLNYLKGSLAAAFTPILTYIMPVLTSFIDQIAAVINAIGMMIAKLTGAKSYMRATKTSANYAAGSSSGGGSSGKSAEEKYQEAVAKAQAKYEKEVAKVAEKNAKAAAKAEEQQAKAAARLAKQQEKANKQLADFDDLNVLNIEDLEELEEIEAEVYDEPELELPDREDFIDAASGGGGGGQDFGLEEVLLGDQEWDWNYLKDKAEELGRGIADALNDFFANDQLAKDIGHNIAEALNTALHFAYGFIDELDWLQMGKWFGELIQEGIETFEWDLLGDTIGELLNGLADTIIGFFEGYNVGTLGESIATFFNNAIETVDAEKLGTAVSDLLKAPFIELKQFFTKTNWEKMGQKIREFIDKAFNSKDLNGKSLGTTIGECLGAAFAAGIKTLRSVHLNELIVDLYMFIHDLILGAFDEFDKQGGWANLGKVLYDIANGIFTVIFILISEVMGLIIDALNKIPGVNIENLFPHGEELELMKNNFITAYDIMGEHYQEFLDTLYEIEDGTTFTASQLAQMQKDYKLTDDQIEQLIRKMKEINPALDESALGLEEYEGNWSAFKDRFGTTTDEIINNMLKTQAQSEKTTEALIGDSVEQLDAIEDFEEELGIATDKTTELSDTLVTVMKHVVEDGLRFTAEELKQLQEEYKWTDEEMEVFIEKIKEVYTEEELAANGIKDCWLETKYYADVTQEAAQSAKDLANEEKGLADTSNNNRDIIAGLGGAMVDVNTTTLELGKSMGTLADDVEKTGEKVDEFIDFATGDMKVGEDSAKHYEETTVEALQGISDASKNVVSDFDGMKELVGVQLEGLTSVIDEWYQNMILTYFGYDVWYTLLTENIGLAFMDFFTNDFYTNWDTTMELWWNDHVLIWFSNDKWNTDVYTPWETYRNSKWQELMKWWDDMMKKWWEDKVVPWFKEDKWKEQFMKIHNTAEKVGKKTKETVSALADETKGAVLEACEVMKEAIAEILAMLGEAMDMANEITKSASGGGGGSSSGTKSGGGSGRTTSGGPRSFMPMLDIMHFEDNLGMSAFQFPELATGAVIPPNNEFLALLGDQRSGTNIETPLATMIQAFRTVMEEYAGGRNQNAIMEVDGETFARLMLPYVMNEMRRQGYNTEIIEGI